MSGKFNGFPHELAGFWFELHIKNNISDQAQIKEKYKRIITRPLTLLYEALAPAVLEISKGFETKPLRCISSPYTDRRFSPGVPFKEYMYIRFKQSGKAEDIPGLYFDMGVDGYSYGLRIYNQTSKGIERLRNKITDNFNLFDAALKEIVENGFTIIGDKYKKDKYPYLPDSVAKDLLGRKRFYICRNIPVNEGIYTDALDVEIRDGFTKMKNILEIMEQ